MEIQSKKKHFLLLTKLSQVQTAKTLSNKFLKVNALLCLRIHYESELITLHSTVKNSNINFPNTV